MIQANSGNLHVHGYEISSLKYGENSWQSPATLYGLDLQNADPLGILRFRSADCDFANLSATNLTDLSRLLQTITHVAANFDANGLEVPYITIGCKHGNPCGAAITADAAKIPEALEKMLNGSPQAIYGGNVITNFPVTGVGADVLSKKFLSGLIAPSISPQARDKLRCKLFVNPELERLSKDSLDSCPKIGQIRGGIIVQPNYIFILQLSSLFSFGKWDRVINPDVLLSRAICDTSNSNTITVVRDGMLLANAVGQQSRVLACKLAVMIAGENGHSLKGSVASSDSFFPFSDGPEVLINAGVGTILTTCGSKRDQETIKLCQAQEITLLMIPDTVGRGFFGH